MREKAEFPMRYIYKENGGKHTALTLAVVGFFVLLFINAGFNGEWALYGACGLAIFFNYLNIDWMYKGLEEYGYITGRSLVLDKIKPCEFTHGSCSKHHTPLRGE